MSEAIRMPALGQTTEDLRIIRWLKEEGDTVRAGDPLLEVETDKATLEVEAAVGGTLLKTLYPVDTVVQAGTVIAYIGDSAQKVMPDEAGSDPVAEHQINDPVGVATGGNDEITGKQDVAAALESTGNEAASAVRTDRVRARPTARKLAKDHQIDIQQVAGTGPDGLIEKGDVQRYLERSQTVTGEGEDFQRGRPAAAVEVPRHRRVIARRLQQSIQTIPQIHLTMTFDMSRIRTMIQRREMLHLEGLTYTHFLLMALAAGLRAHPNINVQWDDNGPHLLRFSRADVGLAVAAADNLLVPTVPEPDLMSLTALVQTVDEITQRARSGKLAQEDMSPASVTLSNLGMYHVDDFQAIVDPNQTAILAIGRVVDEVVALDGGIFVVPQARARLSIDHRVADGVAAAKFLGTIREYIQSFEIH
jgi:pyruvate dehydrogenase E2 component (dihydrolipoamide acetyltransferase)